MKKDVDKTKLIIPPYVSTSWCHVAALFVQDDTLIVDMKDGHKIKIPGLSKEELENIFSFHAASMEGEVKKENPFKFQPGDSPFQFAFDSADGMSSAMKHNPDQANLPILPSEIIDKVAQIAKLFGAGDLPIFDPPVEGCNCIHCQVTRAISGQSSEKPTQPETFEEEISDADLHFEEWIVEEVGDKLYEVSNKLNKSEMYRVFLGDPVGCTCGERNCAHIISVLKS